MLRDDASQAIPYRDGITQSSWRSGKKSGQCRFDFCLLFSELGLGHFFRLLFCLFSSWLLRVPQLFLGLPCL